MSGLANMTHKLADIDNESEKIINSQQKIKDDVSEMTDYFTKMSGDMVNLRKDLSDLSESVGRQMKELKETMSSFINSRLNPTRGSPKRKKGSQAELNMGHHQTRPAHAPQFIRRNHGIARVNLMEMTIASSAQRVQKLPMTIVQRQSWWGLTCINGSSRTPGWGIHGPICPQATLENWKNVQTRRRCSLRRGYRSASYHDIAKNREFTLPPPIVPLL
jgi:hypothetical protein